MVAAKRYIRADMSLVGQRRRALLKSQGGKGPLRATEGRMAAQAAEPPPRLELLEEALQWPLGSGAPGTARGRV